MDFMINICIGLFLGILLTLLFGDAYFFYKYKEPPNEDQVNIKLDGLVILYKLYGDRWLVYGKKTATRYVIAPLRNNDKTLQKERMPHE